MKKKQRVTFHEIDFSEALFTRLVSSGAVSARLYGLARVHKRGAPQRRFFSLPGSLYYTLNMKHWQYIMIKLRRLK